MNADQLTNPRSNVLTACPERSEGFKRSNAPTFHPRPLFLKQPHLFLKQLTRSILQ
jgi:hypothetical protein